MYNLSESDGPRLMASSSCDVSVTNITTLLDNDDDDNDEDDDHDDENLDDEIKGVLLLFFSIGGKL